MEFWAHLATIIALFFGVAAVFYAGCQFSLARKAGSGASLIALSEAFRQCWQQFTLTTDEPKRRHAFADLANTLEIACAVFRDGVMHGASEDVLKYYLVGVFAAIEESEDARQRLVDLLQSRSTFAKICRCYDAHRPDINRYREASRFASQARTSTSSTE